MRCWLGPILLALVFAVLGLAGSANALEPGVFVDPNSPAGKEYAFPLGVLRSQGAGHRLVRAGAPGPLFGVGITASSGTRLTASGTARRTSLKVRKGSGVKTGSTRPHGVGGVGNSQGAGEPGNLEGGTQLSQAALIRLARPGSAVLAVGLVVILVLAAGLVLGVAARTVRRRS